MLPEDLQCLKTIGLLGGCRGPVWINSQTLATALDTSPQTASRRLKSLESQRAIRRSIRPDGQHVTITREGEEKLHEEYTAYCRIFEKGGKHYQLWGEVISGLGEGRYYMSLPHYRQQFQEALGYVPYPGTLNVRLQPSCAEIRRRIDALTWVHIPGFTAQDRTFGAARCLPCRIEGVPCAIVVPGRTHYPEDVIEVVSGQELRSELDLRDRSPVTLEVEHD